MKNWLRKIGHNLVDFLYNADRAVASLGGAPAEQTISGEIGEHRNLPVAKQAAEVLDLVQKDHVENAAAHGEYLDSADIAYYSQVSKKEKP